MIKKFVTYNFIIFYLIYLNLPSFAFEDYLIINDDKLTDISIEHNDIINVFPIITIMNEKNTLYVQPLKVGDTRFCVLKGKKDKIMFNVSVKEDETIIQDVEGFDILKVDVPIDNFEFDLDLPPIINSGEKTWIN